MKNLTLTLFFAFATMLSYSQYIGAGINVADTTWDMTVITGPAIGQKVLRVKGNDYMHLNPPVIKFSSFSGSGTRVIGFNTDGSIYSLPQYSLIDTTKLATKFYANSAGTGLYYPLSGNPSNFITQSAGDVRYAMIADTFPVGNIMTTRGANNAIGILTTSVNGKQNTLVSGTNIKTLETQSLLGSGNIDLTKSDVGLANVDNTSDASKNVLSATKFTTARTINGVSFDGTANITIPSVKRQETYTGTTLTTGSIGTYTVTFGTSYSAAPNIQVAVQSDCPSCTAVVSSKSTTGFTVKVYQLSSILSLGLVPQYSPVGSITVDVLVTEK